MDVTKKLTEELCHSGEGTGGQPAKKVAGSRGADQLRENNPFCGLSQEFKKFHSPVVVLPKVET